MAKRRDVIIAVVIGMFFLCGLILFGFMFIGIMSEDGNLEFAGWGGNVGIVKVTGLINEEMGRPIIEQLDKWAENNSIKAIVVHVNSGGGGVAISQEIYDAVLRASEDKPVVASMASVAASGGYYISCAADRIIANPGTLTGSIGVIMQFHTAEGLMDKIGIGTETVKSGKLKDVGNYSRSMTKNEELMLRSVVMDTYEQFVEAVANGRGKDADDIYPLADGSIFTGSQAFNLGLVDTLGGLKEAIDLAANLADIDGEPKIVRPKPKKDAGLFDLLGGVFKSVGSTLETNQTGPKLMYLYQ
ncbi:MAG: signal peptide peptidase SppA [candidate division Zixibacteria bacterium]|nr:signal peptide peptidase SppA [candidate division Zixibacteria bacterium]